MIGKKLTKKQAQKLLEKHDKGKASWKVRHEQVACAANTGDSGWKDIYNNGENDILSIEYPHSRYKVLCTQLIS